MKYSFSLEGQIKLSLNTIFFLNLFIYYLFNINNNKLDKIFTIIHSFIIYRCAYDYNKYLITFENTNKKYAETLFLQASIIIYINNLLLPLYYAESNIIMVIIQSISLTGVFLTYDYKNNIKMTKKMI
jgi:hypothetical protein